MFGHILKFLRKDEVVAKNDNPVLLFDLDGTYAEELGSMQFCKIDVQNLRSFLRNSFQK